MDVILFADRKGQELMPLTDETCVPLLPMAGKMVIIGKMSDMREMTGEKKVKAGMAGYKAGAVAGKNEKYGRDG